MNRKLPNSMSIKYNASAFKLDYVIFNLFIKLIYNDRISAYFLLTPSCRIKLYIVQRYHLILLWDFLFPYFWPNKNLSHVFYSFYLGSVRIYEEGPVSTIFWLLVAKYTETYISQDLLPHLSKLLVTSIQSHLVKFSSSDLHITCDILSVAVQDIA